MSCSVELLEGELSAASSSWCPGISCGVQHQRAVTAAFSGGLGRGERMKRGGREAEEAGQGEAAACLTSLNETITPGRS